MPMSTRRAGVAAAELVCRDESTLWPVRAASMAMRAVSTSRTSPTSTTSGSARRMERRAEAKVRPAFMFSCTCLMPGMRYSMGSSTVTMVRPGSLISLSVA